MATPESKSQYFDWICYTVNQQINSDCE